MLTRVNDEFASKLEISLKSLNAHKAQIAKLTELSLINFDKITADATLSSSLRSVQANIAAIREEVLSCDVHRCDTRKNPFVTSRT